MHNRNVLLELQLSLNNNSAVKAHGSDLVPSTCSNSNNSNRLTLKTNAVKQVVTRTELRGSVRCSSSKKEMPRQSKMKD